MEMSEGWRTLLHYVVFVMSDSSQLCTPTGCKLVPFCSHQKSRDRKSHDQKSHDQKSHDRKSRDQKSRDQKSRDQKSRDHKSHDRKSHDQKWCPSLLFVWTQDVISWQKRSSDVAETTDIQWWSQQLPDSSAS